jgi:hypothetical protein
MSSDPLSHTAEYNRLFDALPIAIKRAGEILQRSSSNTAAYLAADMEVSRILARITELTNDYLRASSEVEARPPQAQATA